MNQSFFLSLQIVSSFSIMVQFGRCTSIEIWKTPAMHMTVAQMCCFTLCPPQPLTLDSSFRNLSRVSPKRSRIESRLRISSWCYLSTGWPSPWGFPEPVLPEIIQQHPPLPLSHSSLTKCQCKSMPPPKFLSNQPKQLKSHAVSPLSQSSRALHLVHLFGYFDLHLKAIWRWKGKTAKGFKSSLRLAKSETESTTGLGIRLDTGYWPLDPLSVIKDFAYGRFSVFKGFHYLVWNPTVR